MEMPKGLPAHLAALALIPAALSPELVELISRSIPRTAVPGAGPSRTDN